MMVAALAEGGLFFSLLAAALLAKTEHLSAMVWTLQQMPIESLLPLLIAFCAFFIALLAENKRFPVDNPATHLELTMIHEAMILEHSGKRLAMLEWASAMQLLIFVALGVNIFFPWGVTTTLTFGALALSLAIFVAKVVLVLFVIAAIESTVAKRRIFRIPDLLFTSFVLGIISVGIIILA
jgi:formate hydrogenlyase subunit 4